MNQVIKNVKLQFTQRNTYFVSPPLIILAVAVLSALISLGAIRGGVDINDPDFVDGAKSNAAILWSMVGFLGYLGVASVATTFPLALSLGTTRRSFVFGTMISHVLLSAYISALILVLLGIELLTDHWFANLYIVDIYMLGEGNPFILVAVVFLATLTTLSIGAFFASVWIRFGNKGPAALGIVLALLLALVVVIFAPYFETFFSNFQVWWLAVAAGVVILVSAAAEYFSLRKASVR